jgi:hypothetical protein
MAYQWAITLAAFLFTLARDPLPVPASLLKARQDMDRAVHRCYRREPFPSDRHRVEYLFALYEKLTAPLVAAAKPARKRPKIQAAD